jgi:hypothetical protein
MFGLNAHGQAPMGSEFQVNEFTIEDQAFGKLAVDSSGAWIAAWLSVGQDGELNGIFGRLFDSSGGALVGDFQVNTNTPLNQSYPAVDRTPAGDFVIAWQSVQDGDSVGIFAQRFDPDGLPLGGEFQVNQRTVLRQERAAVAADSAGNFVIAWQSDLQDGSSFGVVARRYDSSGAALGSEFQVNVRSQNNQRYPRIAADSAGNFVIVWQSQSQDGDGYGIFARQFDSTGLALGPDLQINEFTTGHQRRPDVACDGAGNFIVAWHSQNQDGDISGVFARRFDSAGVALGPEFLANTFTPLRQEFAAVGAGSLGDFVIAWHSGHDGDLYGIFARSFDSAGIAAGPDFQVNTFSLDYQIHPDVAFTTGKDFLIVWTSIDQDGDHDGLFAQMYSGGATTPRIGAGGAEGSASTTRIFEITP